MKSTSCFLPLISAQYELITSISISFCNALKTRVCLPLSDFNSSHNRYWLIRSSYLSRSEEEEEEEGGVGGNDVADKVVEVVPLFSSIVRKSEFEREGEKEKSFKLKKR